MPLQHPVCHCPIPQSSQLCVSVCLAWNGWNLGISCDVQALSFEVLGRA